MEAYTENSPVNDPPVPKGRGMGEWLIETFVLQDNHVPRSRSTSGAQSLEP